MTQLGLLSYVAPQAKATAPEGVRRAARAGSRVDAAVIEVCRESVGSLVTEIQFWDRVNARAACLPDTARRRRDALVRQGLITVDRPVEKLGVFRVVEVKP